MSSENKYGIHESKGWFGRLEGTLYSELFGCDIPFMTKGSREIYAERCAGYFEGLTADSEMLEKLFRAAALYIEDLLDEHEDDFDIPDFDPDAPADDLIGFFKPVLLIFEKLDVLTDEDCPPSFSLKLGSNSLADEYVEIAARDGVAVYAGEYRGVSPWNENLLKKKWNYLNAL